MPSFPLTKKALYIYVGLAQPIANWAKRVESHPEDGGERYRRLLGNRGVLAHTRGVREPPIHIAPRAPDTTRPPCFLASQTSRFLLPTHHPGWIFMRPHCHTGILRR